MSYEPTNWKNGDIITAEKLNNIETKMKNLADNIVFTYAGTGVNSTITCNKTFAEVADLLLQDNKTQNIDVCLYRGGQRFPAIKIVLLQENITATFVEFINFSDEGFELYMYNLIFKNDETITVSSKHSRAYTPIESNIVSQQGSYLDHSYSSIKGLLSQNQPVYLNFFENGVDELIILTRLWSDGTAYWAVFGNESNQVTARALSSSEDMMIVPTP